MSEQSRLCIHTKQVPEETPKDAEGRRPAKKRRKRSVAKNAPPSKIVPLRASADVGARGVQYGTADPAPVHQSARYDAVSVRAQSAASSGKETVTRKRVSSNTIKLAKKSKKPRSKPSPGDRLLRNSAIACAVLLGVLALGNIHQPWAEKASAGIEQALTMHIDLDESIGSLTFVREIMPESALVFMNLSGASAMTKPADGPVVHSWSGVQPWIMFACQEGVPVYAAAAGIVTAVSPLSGGLFGVLIDHGEGLESVYASLTEVRIAVGDAVQRGQEIGAASENLYYELRQSGESIDPTARLGL